MTELEIFSRVKVTNQEGFFNWFKKTGVEKMTPTKVDTEPKYRSAYPGES